MTKEPSRTLTDGYFPSRRVKSELHPVETLKQGPGVLLITRLARIVSAQRQTAHAGQQRRWKRRTTVSGEG